MADFSGKIILITGATGGLGGAVSRAFLNRNATVVGVSGSGKPVATERGKYAAVSADLTTTEGVNHAVAAALSEAQRLDAVVHILGGFAGGSPVVETDDATWDRMMNLNLRAAFLVARASLPHLVQSGHGRLVAVGSRTGVTPAARISAYGASKAGLNALIQTIALEVKDTGTTANAVLPSVIDTPQNRAAMPDADHSKWVSAESIANLILYLASDAAADVNGALIPIYGRA